MSRQLSEARGCSIGVFDSQSAGRTTEFLAANPIDSEQLGQFLLAEYGEQAPEPELLIAARDTLLTWLGRVDERSVGLLTVG